MIEHKVNQLLVKIAGCDASSATHRQAAQAALLRSLDDKITALFTLNEHPECEGCRLEVRDFLIQLGHDHCMKSAACTQLMDECLCECPTCTNGRRVLSNG